MRTTASGRATLDTSGTSISAGTAVWNAVVFVKLGSIEKYATAVQTGLAGPAPMAHQTHITRGQVIHTIPTTVSGSATLDTENMRISVSFATSGNIPLEALARVKTAKSATPMHIRVVARWGATLMIENVNVKQACRAVAQSAIFATRGSTSLVPG